MGGEGRKEGCAVLFGLDWIGLEVGRLGKHFFTWWIRIESDGGGGGGGVGGGGGKMVHSTREKGGGGGLAWLGEGGVVVGGGGLWGGGGGGGGVCVGVYMYNVQSYTEERGGGGIALPRRRGLTPPLYL